MEFDESDVFLHQDPLGKKGFSGHSLKCPVIRYTNMEHWVPQTLEDADVVSVR